MAEWRAQLKKLTACGNKLPQPFAFFHARPPSGQAWPEGVPSSPTLRELYTLCDGGRFSRLYAWLPQERLIYATEEWAVTYQQFEDDFDEGDDPFDSGRHVVLTTEDETGGPLVWDATTDQLAIFGCDPDGGFGWEPVHKGLESFLQTLFSPPPNSIYAKWDTDWVSAMQHLEKEHQG